MLLIELMLKSALGVERKEMDTESLAKRLAHSRCSVIKNSEYDTYSAKLNEFKLDGIHLKIRQPC